MEYRSIGETCLFDYSKHSCFMERFLVHTNCAFEWLVF